MKKLQLFKRSLIAGFCCCLMLVFIAPSINLFASETVDTSAPATSSVVSSASSRQEANNNNSSVQDHLRLFGDDIPQDYRGIWSINVLGLINDDGSLTVRELWQANMSDSGNKELYIRKKLNHMKLKEGSYHVSALDMSAGATSGVQEFTASPNYSWNVDASFDEKAYHYGLVQDGDYTEFCFGISKYAPMLYIVDYTLENAFLTYSDGEIGANIRFINDKLSSVPQLIAVHLAMADPNKVLDQNNSKVWAFGFKGQSGYIDDTSQLFTPAKKHIMAYNEGEVSSDSHITLLLQLDKSLLTAPNDPLNRSFKEVQDTAFEGSDYDNANRSSGRRWFPTRLIIPIIVFISAYFSSKRLSNKYKVKNRKQVAISSTPSSTIPLNADLLLIYFFSTQVTCHNGRRSPLRGSNYISSLFLKWIKQGLLTPFTPLTDKGKRDHQNTKLIVNRTASESDFNDLIESKIWYAYTSHKGSPVAEINSKSIKNIPASQIRNITKSIDDSALTRAINQGLIVKNKGSYNFTASGLAEASKLTAFEEFIRNYSLLNERSAYEAAVWDNYLLVATACGLGDTALREMQNLVPDYQFSSETGSFDYWQTIYLLNTVNFASGYGASSPATAGLGGVASIGGGGGFSGGASGGGGR